MDRAQFGVDLHSEDDEQGAHVGSRRVAFDSTGLDRVEFV